MWAVWERWCIWYESDCVVGLYRTSTISVLNKFCWMTQLAKAYVTPCSWLSYRTRHTCDIEQRGVPDCWRGLRRRKIQFLGATQLIVCDLVVKSCSTLRAGSLRCKFVCGFLVACILYTKSTEDHSPISADLLFIAVVIEVKYRYYCWQPVIIVPIFSLSFDKIRLNIEWRTA